MSAHESMEHAENAEHASGETRKIALLIAVIALCLALSETLGKGAQTESIAKNVEAANLWAFFQAKTIRRTVVQTAAEHAKLITPTDDANKAALAKQIEEWQKTAARYRTEPSTHEGSEELAERAKHVDLVEGRQHRRRVLHVLEPARDGLAQPRHLHPLLAGGIVGRRGRAHLHRGSRLIHRRRRGSRLLDRRQHVALGDAAILARAGHG